MGIKETLESERLLAQRTIEVALQHRRRLSAISVAQIGNAANLHRVSQSQPFRCIIPLRRYMTGKSYTKSEHYIGYRR